MRRKELKPNYWPKSNRMRRQDSKLSKYKKLRSLHEFKRKKRLDLKMKQKLREQLNSLLLKLNEKRHLKLKNLPGKLSSLVLRLRVNRHNYRPNLRPRSVKLSSTVSRLSVNRHDYRPKLRPWHVK